MFEAARWAPSAFNLQPWRFVYAKREDDQWPLFLSLLIPFNQMWAKEASALIFAMSIIRVDETKAAEPSYSHSFDAGAAWVSLALQAYHMGLAAHGMTGVDMDRAREVLEVPDNVRLEAAIAVGRAAGAERLPESLRARELPSSRMPIGDFVAAGRFAR